jgi:hypothetical protein
MMKRHKVWMLLSLLVFHLHGKGQTFAYKSPLDTVPQSGFYTISLSLDWLVHLKNDLSDIRIKNEHNETVPFIIKKYPTEQHSSFVNFPILKFDTDSAWSSLELDAIDQHGTDHLCLIIGNHAVERIASLSGSDDRNHWFIIDEKLPLINRTGQAGDRFMQWLSFPFIRYRYLKLKINNKGTDPLPILKAGIYTDTSLNESLPLYLQPGTTYQQKDSADGRSYVWVHNPHPYPVDRISMVLSGPKFYKRAVSVYKLQNEKGKELIGSGEARSGEDPAVWIIGGKAQDLLVVIENGDNPPLKITTVNTQCRKQELIAYLEKGKKYVLFGGNASVAPPDYDLAQFRDSIPRQTAVLDHGHLSVNKEETISAVTSKKNWWIWPAIIAMIVVLSMLTYKLTGEMKGAKV